MKQAVSETLKHGKKKNNRISLLFIGQGRVGKTSLKKSLLGEASKKKEPSTIGIEFDVVEVQENDKSNPWRHAKDDQFITSEIYTHNVLRKEVARVMAESKEEPEEGRGGSAAGDEDDGVELEGESGDPSETKNGSEEGADDEVGQGDKDRARDGDEDGAGTRAGAGAGARDGAGYGDDCRSYVLRRGKGWRRKKSHAEKYERPD